MKLIHWAAMAALGVAAGSTAWAQTQAPAPGPFTNTKSIVAWAAKPAKMQGRIFLGEQAEAPR